MALSRIIIRSQRTLPLSGKWSTFTSWSVPLLPKDNEVHRAACCSNYHTTSLLWKRRKTAEERKSAKIIEYSPKAKSEVIDVWKNITVGELAQVLNRDVNYVSDLFLNEVRGKNTVLDDLAHLREAIRRSGKRMRVIARPVNEEQQLTEKDVFPRPPPNKADLKPRPPVVTVMGHVDHGKTTLLDALRHSNVVAKEFGGITQHVGAFSVTLKSGAKITFLDTPGHAAFTSMRKRGANITDIVVLVVATDDGVMEQTVESVKMARQAKVPMLIALNKIDAPNSDIERTQRTLIEIGVQTEDVGGDVQAVAISALKKTNLDQLMEALVLQADLLEIGGDPTGMVEAVVVESKVDPHRGRLCTVIVQRGTVKKGDILIADTALCKVRALRDSDGRGIDKVTPGNPVEIEGWRDLPPAGETVLQVENENYARNVIKIRKNKKELERQQGDGIAIAAKEEQHNKTYREMLEMKRRIGRFKLRRTGPREKEIQIDENATPTFNLIIKSDVDGTLEAILDIVDAYDLDNCKLEIINYGVGAVNENDIELAKTFKGIVYAFNVESSNDIKTLASDSNVTIKHHNVIYKLIDDVKEEINFRLPQKETEEVIGEATFLQQFDINDGRRKIPVAGCRCIKGCLKRAARFKLVRREEVVFDGFLTSMRHLKNEVDTIKKDLECGLQLSDKNVSFEQGDVLVCYEKKKEPQKTSWDPGF